ncbi:DJ-1/PfpI family protein [Acerihabitans arboris]|uniref:DJ-1 family protein n=1 Tax=Acerihabitans arboris TaxID=2691583 RepID=A0A845SHM5_9GAMM|nr:DJ-1/PfpI family protein [Acerihabitans arboris]NDL62121.1 DJ-1 family protein [Acerihabitans arboris]
MTKHVALLLAPGFEEAEAIIILDVLKRLDIAVTTLACHNSQILDSYHGLCVKADALLSLTLLNGNSPALYDAVVIPGGPLGTQSLAENHAVIDFIRRHDDAGKWICPICSAAARVLAPHKLLKGRRYVCSGRPSDPVADGVYVDATVVADGNLLSGQGLGAAFDFAFYLAMRLTGDEARIRRQAEHIYHRLNLAL